MLNTFMTDFKANKTFYGLTVIEENLRNNVDMNCVLSSLQKK